MGSFRLVAGNRHLHRYYNFAGRLLRQCPNHYAFDAGQILRDMEFRFLRTVIVTAAVYRGFNSMLRFLTSPLNLPAPGRRQLIYVIFRFSINLCFW